MPIFLSSLFFSFPLCLLIYFPSCPLFFPLPFLFLLSLFISESLYFFSSFSPSIFLLFFFPLSSLFLPLTSSPIFLSFLSPLFSFYLLATVSPLYLAFVLSSFPLYMHFLSIRSGHAVSKSSFPSLLSAVPLPRCLV